jgi:hypothetical protein
MPLLREGGEASDSAAPAVSAARRAGTRKELLTLAV